MRLIKKLVRYLFILVLSLLLVVTIYVIYMSVDYYRIEDGLELEISNNSSLGLKTNESYKILTYNIGFGAYEQDYSFFMDTGVMLDGTKTKGKYSRALSKESAVNNTKGSIEALKNSDADFMLLQEVDTNSTRSFKVNQMEMIIDAFPQFGNTFAVNFHSSYLAYPLLSPHGKANSGLLCLSKYKITSSVRNSLPISDGFITKFFDLDRCLNTIRYAVGEKELVIISAHFSAYDEGGVYRALQKEMLNEILELEKNKGNYVIVGGDFNHDIANSKELYETSQKTPTWIYDLTDADLIEGYHIASATNAPTCRGADIPYIIDGKKTNVHTVVIDGFIVSDNVLVQSIANIDLDFKYSDHNPVELVFKLN